MKINNNETLFLWVICLFTNTREIIVGYDHYQYYIRKILSKQLFNNRKNLIRMHIYQQS